MILITCLEKPAVVLIERATGVIMQRRRNGSILEKLHKSGLARQPKIELFYPTLSCQNQSGHDYTGFNPTLTRPFETKRAQIETDSLTEKQVSPLHPSAPRGRVKGDHISSTSTPHRPCRGLYRSGRSSFPWMFARRNRGRRGPTKGCFHCISFSGRTKRHLCRFRQN